MGADDYSEYEGDDDTDDFDELGPMPEPSERVWRHPSEIAAQARAEAELAALPAPRSSRVPSPVLIAAAGFVFGIVMVGLIQSSRNSSTNDQLTAPGVVLATPDEVVLVPSQLIESTPTPSSTVVSLVSTTYVSPVWKVRVARPEGVLTVYAADQATILASALATEDMILTSASCLDGHNRVYLSSALGSATMMEASLVGTDSFSDLAVLTTDLPLGDLNLPHSPLHTRALRDEVTVIGGGETLLTDAPSGKVLQLNTETKSADGYQLAGIASTSVQVSDSDAGGGLFDSDKMLLGLVVKTDDHLASVLPIEDALRLARTMTRTGFVSSAYAGIAGVSHPDGGIMVNDVSIDSPAEFAGIEQGDTIVQIDGQPVDSMADLIHYIRALESGSALQLTLYRGGEPVEVVVDLAWLE